MYRQEKLINGKIFKNSYYLVGKKLYPIEEIDNILTKSRPNKNLSEEEINKIIKQNEEKKKKISRIKSNLNEVKQHLLNELNIYSDKYEEKNKDELNKKYNDLKLNIEFNFENLNSFFQELNKRYKNYFMNCNKDELQKLQDTIHENQKKIDKYREKIQSKIQKIQKLVNEIEIINNYQKFIGNIYNELNQIKPGKIEISFNFIVPEFIDDNIIKFDNYEKKILFLMNIEILYYEEEFKKIKDKIKKEEENRLISENNNRKKELIKYKYISINDSIKKYHENINKNIKEYFQKIKEEYQLFFNENKDKKSHFIFPKNENNSDQLMDTLKKLIKQQKDILEKELKGFFNNISVRNNNLKEDQKLKGKSNSINLNQKVNSQPKIIVPRFKNYQENVDRKQKYNLKPIKGIVCYPVGLKNLGNTCYMNSCIQCLKHCFPFAYYILKEYMPNPSSIGYQFQKLMKDLFSEKSSTDASDFKDKIGNQYSIYQSKKQYDSCHFFLHLLKTLNDEILSSNSNIIIESQSNSESESPSKSPSESSESPSENESDNNDLQSRSKNKCNRKEKNQGNNIFNINEERQKINKKKSEFFSKNNTKFNRLFVGFLINEIEYCCNHNKIHQSVCSYNYINLDIIDYNNGQRLDDLKRCLEYYTKDFYMTGNNRIYCSKCKSSVKGISRIKIVDLPEILVINLRRVVGNNYYSHYVDYPVNLDLSKYIKGDKLDYSTLYTLKGIIQHYGNDDGGHKIAICNNFSNNNWFYYSDDSEPRLIDETKIFSYTSHLFFYERCDLFKYKEPSHQLAEKDFFINHNINKSYVDKKKKNFKSNGFW